MELLMRIKRPLSLKTNPIFLSLLLLGIAIIEFFIPVLRIGSYLTLAVLTLEWVVYFLDAKMDAMTIQGEED